MNVESLFGKNTKFSRNLFLYNDERLEDLSVENEIETSYNNRLSNHILLKDFFRIVHYTKYEKNSIIILFPNFLSVGLPLEQYSF